MQENPTGPDRRGKRPRGALVLLAVAVLAAGITAVVVRLSGDDTATSPPSAGATSTSAAATTTSGTTAPGSPTTGPGATSDPPFVFDHQPLWPFATPAEAAAWEDSYRSGGQQPWHLDPAATATAFTTGYLGFTGLGTTTSTSVVGREAWIGVGYPVEGRAPSTAAVVHLVRYGSGADAPWEVVGTRDSSFSLTSPGYGAEVRSPVAVGGRVTGVDESIRVRVLRLGAPAVLGEACCTPAGGTDSAWNATVTFSGPGTGAVTIVASTGGHYTDVERFAITGVTA